MKRKTHINNCMAGPVLGSAKICMWVRNVPQQKLHKKPENGPYMHCTSRRGPDTGRIITGWSDLPVIRLFS